MSLNAGAPAFTPGRSGYVDNTEKFPALGPAAAAKPAAGGKFTDKATPTFDWTEPCIGFGSATQLCSMKTPAQNYNTMAIYLGDIIPFLLSSITKILWNRRMKKPPFDAIKTQNMEWPDETAPKADKQNFLASLLQSSELIDNEKKTGNKYKAALGAIRKAAQKPPTEKFKFDIPVGTYTKKLDGQEKKMFYKGIEHWDIPLLKNFLMYFKLGVSPTYKNLLEDFPDKIKGNLRNTEQHKRDRLTALRDIYAQRNTFAHGATGYTISEATFKDFKIKFENFVTLFVDNFKEGDPNFKKLSDILDNKREFLKKTQFTFQSKF